MVDSLPVTDKPVSVELVKQYFESGIRVREDVIKQESEHIGSAGLAMAKALKAGGKLLVCGNGGSAADAQHFATELLIRYKASNVRPALPAISLAADSSMITAGGNDFGYDFIFSRQVEGLGREGDVLLGISTSGNSPNIIEAFKVGVEKKMTNILLTGAGGGKLYSQYPDLFHYGVCIPSKETSLIQECHIAVIHLFCTIIEKELYGF